ncbi:hypothetical protein [Streptomyces sp. NPDC006510]
MYTRDCHRVALGVEGAVTVVLAVGVDAAAVTRQGAQVSFPTAEEVSAV